MKAGPLLKTCILRSDTPELKNNFLDFGWKVVYVVGSCVRVVILRILVLYVGRWFVGWLVCWLVAVGDPIGSGT